MTDPAIDSPTGKLTTDPPRPPGAPDVDDLVRDPTPTGDPAGARRPEDEDVTEEDTVSVEPPD